MRHRPTPRRLAVAAALLTVLVVLADLSGALDLSPVRTLAAAGLGPLERVAGPGGDEASRLRAENTELRTRLADADRRLAESADARALLSDPALEGRPLVLARVVGVGAPGPAGPERVTLDVGSRDGVEVDRTVVAAGGLVGRVVAVAPWTCDVLLLGGPDVTVGVRVGSAGVLGEASGSAAEGAAPPPPGSMSLSLVGAGAMAAGDPVTTLGSAGGRPFVAGIRVGTVGSVAPAAGRLAATGTLEPAVDPATLDVVGVVVDPQRSTPRPTATGSG
ncbi:rod shape-determining protein MreC [Phycicoccus sonneratiae]|uniref:Cell shape-determining protein MreC n=1 Tax=Phycicoccus sonneratiae TaxID=2807628 RepID=A0ABS2CGM1_9MICO|nr:rod shape-determining protein MreC [Phycicoccus sonneraticus]MBM6399020.1 rod shape-determining protein MreC [Phycicoccus sonneraticus]